MGLRDALKSAARAAVVAVGDLAASAVYHSHATTVYDASAGTPTVTYSTVGGCRVIVSEFRLADNDPRSRAPDFDVRAEDKQADLPASYVSGVTPKPKDRIVIDGETWNVVNVGTDPAEALWQLQIRRP